MVLDSEKHYMFSTLSANGLRVKGHFSSQVVYMCPCSLYVSVTIKTFRLFIVLICLSNVFMCSSGRGIKKITVWSGDLSIRTNGNQHVCTQEHSSKRVPGMVTFHISFKSMRDYSPPVMKEERKKTLIKSISLNI